MLERFFKDLVIPDIRGRIQLNVVAYGSPKGIPSRFFVGIIPAILLAKEFIAQGKDVCIRVFNPITIASFCNGWQDERQNKKAITLAEKFLEKQGIPFFFDPSLPVSDEMMKALQPLEEAIRNEPTLQGTLKRLEASGLRYGGGIGKKQSALYAVAHPFGWQDLWHQSLWLSKPVMGTTVINIMSEAEKPFSTARRFLVERFPSLCLAKVYDLYTKTCEVPHYVFFPLEPSIEDLLEKRIGECLQRYGTLLEDAVRKDEKKAIRSLIKDFNCVIDFTAQSEEIFNDHECSFKITRRECLAFLREIEANIQAQGERWIAKVMCAGIGQYKACPLYVTFRGRPFVYDSNNGCVKEIFYREIGKESN